MKKEIKKSLAVLVFSVLSMINAENVGAAHIDNLEFSVGNSSVGEKPRVSFDIVKDNLYERAFAYDIGFKLYANDILVSEQERVILRFSNLGGGSTSDSLHYDFNWNYSPNEGSLLYARIENKKPNQAEYTKFQTVTTDTMEFNLRDRAITPEPGIVSLLGAGFLPLLYFRRRVKKN